MKMRKIKIAGLILMLGIFLQSNVLQAYAETAAELEANRVDPIDSGQKCSLEIKLSVEDEKEEIKILDMKVNIYRVAGLSVEGGSATYIPIPPFDSDSVDYTKIKDASASNQIAEKLRKKAGKATGLQAVTDRDGKAKFEALEVGMYLVVQAEEKDGYTFDPFIISVPYAEKAEDSGKNVWDYQVSAWPKTGIKKEVPPTPVKPTPSPKPTKPGKTKTGDDTNFEFLLAQMGVSLLGIVCVAAIIRNRRKSTGDQKHTEQLENGVYERR